MMPKRDKGGFVNVTSSDLEMIIDGANIQIIGLRFNNLNIPQGAIIESAFVQFTVDQTDNVNPVSLEIYGEDVDNAITFTTALDDISNRPKTTANVVWVPADWENVGDVGPAQKNGRYKRSYSGNCRP